MASGGSESNGGARWLWPAAAFVVAAIAVAWWFVPGAKESRPAPDPQRPVETGSVGDRVAPAREVRLPESLPSAAGPDVPPFEPGPNFENESIQAAWSAVDMEEVRRALPGNLYWTLSMPTQDPKVEEERKTERDRWNVEYGKILSGTGTAEEITAYYDQRARLSSDYIEFTTYLIDHYGKTLSERDVGLLELARRLHAARLEEIPRKIEEAMERKRQQDEARAAWLADEAQFKSGAAAVE